MPTERRAAIEAVRKVVLKNLPKGYKETEKWSREAYAASGKKLDMGKSCVRFKKIQNLPIDVLGKVIARTSVEDF